MELIPEVKDGHATLSFEMEAEGFGAVLASDSASPSADLTKFLGEMNVLGKTRLDSFSRERRVLTQQVVEIPPTKPASNPPAGMVTIPAGDFDFQVEGIEIEGDNEIGVDVQYPWENSPRRNHHHAMHVKSFHIDRYPVTNAEFKKFLDATKYRPKDDHNFLKDWTERRISRGLGEQAGDLGFARRRARVCGLGGQAPSARMGVAVRSPGNRWTDLSVGKQMG